MAKDFKEAFSNISKIVKGVSDKSNLTEIGKEVVEMVRKRTQLGYGVDDNNKKDRLTPLEPSTKDQRKRKSKKGELSENTSQGKSNLTQTGDMLKAITITKVADNTLEIGFNDQFSEDKAIWNSYPTRHSNARPFMNLSTQEIKRVKDKLKDIAERLIKGLK